MNLGIPVFLASDNNYAPFVATTIASICCNTDSFIAFYVLDGGIKPENRVKIESLQERFNNFSIEFLTIDKALFKDFKETCYITTSMYSRFLIPELKPDIDRALYSDVDVIVLGDIAQMYHENLDGHIIGAVRCAWSWNEHSESPQRALRRKNLGLSDNHKYFTSGNLLIDCKKWRKEKITEKLFAIEKKYRQYLQSPDQDILNVCFDNNYQQLNRKYGYCNEDFDYFKDKDPEIIIRHFACQIKPWQLNKRLSLNSGADIALEHFEDFWKFAKMTSFYEDLRANYDKNLPDVTRQSKIWRIIKEKRGEYAIR